MSIFDRFYGGLRTSLKCELKRFNISDLETAIHMLSRLEDINNKPEKDTHAMEINAIQNSSIKLSYKQ